MIIAFGNKARQGKDTAGEAIQKWYFERNKVAQKHGYPTINLQRVNFADALKKEVTQHIYALDAQAYRATAQDLIDYMKLPTWVTVDPNPASDPLLPHGKHSKLLQWWGGEYRRSQDPAYWIKKWKEQVEGFKGISVTCDLRYINEAEAIKSIGGHTVNVTRLNRDGSPFVDPTRDSKHISEVELDGYNFDFYIKVVDGHAALVEQYAITLAEYLRQLENY